MDFFKKNLFFILLFFIGLILIHKSVDLGRSYFVNYISRNQLSDPSKFNVLLDKSILKYIVIGSILSLFSIFKIKK
ncbi:hypothetical protein [Clostridium taeniosporum]|uniref:Uncharacterized protein n=1 Tax=Clostridium taeniosporum TaxID=394958 RepID=A0A1D7XP10_9CLOT|nr:hypothetical protein [Clostridium taeniosporum]AOR25082.1 hypothetical protein BGI42_15155 [Clostridium taeniosporum]